DVSFGTRVFRFWMANVCRTLSWSTSVSSKTSSASRRATARRFLGVVLCLISPAMQQLARAEELKPFEASFAWSWHGMTVAVSTLKLEQHQDTWLYAQKSTPRGIGHFFSERPVSQSTLQVTATGVRPLHYKADDGTSSTKRDADVVFDWEHMHATGV